MHYAYILIICHKSSIGTFRCSLVSKILNALRQTCLLEILIVCLLLKIKTIVNILTVLRNIECLISRISDLKSQLFLLSIQHKTQPRNYHPVPNLLSTLKSSNTCEMIFRKAYGCIRTMENMRSSEPDFTYRLV
jgi:hypothetical protein